MENPETWGNAERVVQQALHDHDVATAQGYIGLSRARRITDALRAAGFKLDPGDDYDGV